MDEPVIQHWLVSVARAAELPGAEGLGIDSGSAIEAAWDLVTMTTGVSDDELALRVARHYRLEVANLAAADPHAHRLLPASVARRRNVIALGYSDRVLTVATADPVSLESERELGHIASRSVDFQVAAPRAISEWVAALYPTSGEPRHELPPLDDETKGGPLILVVDDEADMRRLLRVTLEKAGFRVVEAADGARALEVIAGPEPISLVTLDLKMEGMGGLDVLRRIRSRVPTANLPVVVATGSDDPAVEVELFEAGADDFVVKPVDPPRFVLRVQAVLRRRSRNPLADLI